MASDMHRISVLVRILDVSCYNVTIKNPQISVICCPHDKE